MLLEVVKLEELCVLRMFDVAYFVCSFEIDVVSCDLLLPVILAKVSGYVNIKAMRSPEGRYLSVSFSTWNV